MCYDIMAVYTMAFICMYVYIYIYTYHNTYCMTYIKSINYYIIMCMIVIIATLSRLLLIICIHVFMTKLSAASSYLK